jgi:tripartite-type tricarboxylate transporter receptor subunit TctC
MASLYPGFETDAWYGFFVAAGTPQPIVTRLHDEIMKAQRAPDMRAAMARDGAEPISMGSQEFAAFFKKEVDKYAKLIKLSGAKAE